ncbi:MAG TPA: DUF1697 domain-containing protein, partial [Gemmatimonadales bacterium]|nr:DUF1697 domain-containing protein [Gemmatimonadales bacterium]
LEQGSPKHLGMDLEFFVRTPKEWDAIIAANPFPKEAQADPSHLLVLCLKHKVTPGKVRELQARIVGPESLEARGREAYATFPEGLARSKLTNGLIDRTLGTRSTGRNWNTVLKLAALARDS